MSAPHRDLPPGSQRWAEDVDRAIYDRLAKLEDLVRRLASDARVDPSNPNAGITDQNMPPSAQSAQQARITQFADVKAYNVLDGQALTWSQAEQAFIPQNAGDGFVPDPSTYQYSDFGFGSGPEAEGHNIGAGGQWGFVATSDQEVFATAHDDPTRGGSNAQSRHADMYLGGGEAYLHGYIPTDVAWSAAGASSMVQATPYGITLSAQKGADGSGGQVAVNAPWFLVPAFATSTAPSASGQRGAIYYDSTANSLMVSDGSTWNAVGGGGGSSTFPVPSGAGFTFYGADGKAEGHDTGASGQYGFVATSDREVYLGANDPTYGDANVFASAGAVTIQSDAPGSSSDWNMYSEAVIAKDGISLRSIQGNGTGAGGTVTVLCKWFMIPVNGTLYSAAGKQGAMSYNPSTNKPVWSDGTNWRYADGTAA
jgi:hypothetical protein